MLRENTLNLLIAIEENLLPLPRSSRESCRADVLPRTGHSSGSSCSVEEHLRRNNRTETLLFRSRIIFVFGQHPPTGSYTTWV